MYKGILFNKEKYAANNGPLWTIFEMPFTVESGEMLFNILLASFRLFPSIVRSDNKTIFVIKRRKRIKY